MTPRRTAIALLLLLLAASAHATSFVVPSDTRMIREADAIVIGSVHTMTTEFAADGKIVTRIGFAPEQVLKGEIDESELIEFQELGGTVGRQSMGITEGPVYWIGNRALIFLERSRAGHLRTYGLSLGKFDFVDDAQGRRLAVRWAGQHDVPAWTPAGHPHEEKLRDAGAFVAYIRVEVAHQKRQPQPRRPDETMSGDQPEASGTAPADYFVELESEELPPPDGMPLTSLQTTYPPSAYASKSSDGVPTRWNLFDSGATVTFRINGSQPGMDSTGAAQRAAAAWTNDPGSNVELRISGTTTAGFNIPDEINAIIFNSSADVPSGAIAYTSWWSSGDHIYKGETFKSIYDTDIAVKAGISVSQTVFDEAVAHEMGHAIGFRHSDQGTPSSTAAVMKAVVTGAYGATLGPWDIDAVRTVYTGATTPAPSVPGTLTATATSTTTVQVTWGSSTNATGYELERSTNIAGGFTPVATVTGTSFTDTGRAANTTYVYRVRATGAGGTSNYGNVDHTTTIVFTDDPLLSGFTVVKAVHLTQLRTAVNAVRVAAGLSPVAWTDPSPTGVIIKAVHITELRNALAPALSALGKGASFTDSISRGTIVKAVHLQEIRNLVK